MKKKIILIIVSMVLAACSSVQNTSILEPTVVPTTPPSSTPAQEQVMEKTETPEESSFTDMDALTNNSWMWFRLTDPNQQFDVDNPENYTLTFQPDGTINIKADCNLAKGSYTSKGGSLAIEVGPMTKALCPPESRSDEFVAILGDAASYKFENGNLLIDLKVDGGTLTFTKAQSSMRDILQAHPWQWVSFTSPVEKYQVKDTQNYQLTFNADGTVNIKADCNNAMGGYTSDDSSLTIELGPSTLAACPPESRSDDFLKYLGASAKHFFQDGSLFIDLMADGGTMQFSPQQ
jgi:heat shock protein HslJ